MTSSASPSSTDDATIRAAWLYYIEGLTQEQVACALSMSRAKVIRLLAAARESGVVRIRIEAKGTTGLALERRLIDAFGLAQAIVAPSPADAAATAAIVGEAAGTFMADHVEDGMSIGVGWGETLSMSLKAIGTRMRERLSVVSLLGGMTHSRAVNPSAVARRMADAFGAECYQLTAPVFVASEATRRALWAEPGLAALIARARRVQTALVSVGDLSEDATLFRERLLPRSALASLRRAGAVGDVLCQFVDREGRVIDHDVTRRVVAMPLADLRRVPTIVIAAGGARKALAIRAALAATGAHVLITDEAAASALLDR
jgi:DNA-binding transcriptional regulator LsrR (DeoR family)